MRIACRQTVLMKYNTLFFSKLRKDVQNWSSASVLIGTTINKTFPLDRIACL